jgi:hypothetical protein
LLHLLTAAAAVPCLCDRVLHRRLARVARSTSALARLLLVLLATCLYRLVWAAVAPAAV